MEGCGGYRLSLNYPENHKRDYGIQFTKTVWPGRPINLIWRWLGAPDSQEPALVVKSILLQWG